MPRATSLLLLASLAAPAGAADVPVLSFDEAVAQALGRTPTMEIAAQDIARARALLTEVRAGWLPQLVAAGSYTRLDADRVLNDRVIAARDQTTANLILTVPLLAPQRWAASSHAAADVDVARRNEEEVRRTLGTTVARTYLSVLTQHRVVEIAQRSYETARAHHDYALRRFQGRYGSRLDEVRAAQEVASTAADIDGARAQLIRLQEALGTLVAADHPVDAAGEPPLPTVAEAALEQAVEARSDVRLARRQLASAVRVERDDWTNHAPTLLGVAQPFYQGPPTLTVPRTGWQAQLVLTLPLFEGGLRLGQHREHTALRVRRQAELDAVLLRARSEARQATRVLEQTRDALTHAREAARLADEALSLSTLAYKEGATTNLEVVDAERRARDAATAAALAEDGVRQATLDVLTATGAFPR
jgi:outer membrane protein TolC